MTDSTARSLRHATHDELRRRIVLGHLVEPSELFFAAGATEVYPGVPGLPAVVKDPAALARFERDGCRPARTRFR